MYIFVSIFLAVVYKNYRKHLKVGTVDIGWWRIHRSLNYLHVTVNSLTPIIIDFFSKKFVGLEEVFSIMILGFCFNFI